MRRKRSSIGALIIVTMLLLGVTNVSARDRDFEMVVNQIKSSYRAKRTRIPFLGLAGFAVKVVRPAGVKSFSLAVFEELDVTGKEEAALSRLMRQTLSQEWRPLVRVHSRRDNEQTYIYAREAGDNLKLMIVTIEQREATVIRVKLNPQALAKWMENPKIMGFKIPVDR